MCGMIESPRVKRINELCASPPKERWLHVTTNKEYLLIMEIGGACELEGIDRRRTHATRETLESSDSWRRLP